MPYFVKLRFAYVTEEFENFRHDIEDLHLKIDIKKLDVMSISIRYAENILNIIILSHLYLD